MGGVQRAKHNMCGHGHWQVRQRLKRGKIGPFQLLLRRIDLRQPEMGVRGGPPMTGNVLENRQYTALFQPLVTARPIAATFAGSVP